MMKNKLEIMQIYLLPVLLVLMMAACEKERI